MINILIADDHKIVLEGLSSLIQREGDINIVGEALNGKEVLTILESNVIDVAVLDIEMPELNGVELTKIINEKHPSTKVVILTMHNAIGFIRRIIEAGANGYILKEKGKEELVRAIKDVHAGEEYFGKDVTQTLISSMKNNTVSGEIRLTKREKEVLKLISEGKTTPEISKVLCIAPTTVETHRRNLIDKTGSSNSKGLVRFSLENGYS